MALYRFSAGVIARGRGHSSTAAAAYRAGERITDERTGQTHDYSRRTGVLWNGIYAPTNAPEWMQDRAKLWNAVEQGEKRKDARTAREFIVCIPHELDVEQGRRLLGDFLREQFARKGFVADAAIHAPGKGGDDRNIHAHFLVTTRQVQGGRFVEKKDRTQNEKATLEKWREAWAKLANRHLERAGHPGTLDHRSYQDQGIERTKGTHQGKTARNMERRGIPTETAELAKASEARQKEIAEIRAELARLEAPAEAPSSPPQPANDAGRPESRPANENAAERPPEATPPILKAEAPAGPDPAKPIELATVPVRPVDPAPPPAVAKAPPKLEEPPARVEVSPLTSDAVDATPAPATTQPQPTARTAPPTRAKPKATARQERTRLQRLFTAVAEWWTRGLFARHQDGPRGPHRDGQGTAGGRRSTTPDRRSPGSKTTDGTTGVEATGSPASVATAGPGRAAQTDAAEAVPHEQGRTAGRAGGPPRPQGEPPRARPVAVGDWRGPVRCGRVNQFHTPGAVMTGDEDDREWQENLEREERRRKQRTVLFGTTVQEEVAAEASAAGDPSADRLKLTVNNIPRDFHGELQALAVKHGITLSQLGFTGLMLAVLKDQEGTLAAELADCEWGDLEDKNPAPAGLEFPETVTVSIGLSRDMHHQLQQAAYRDGLSMRRVLQIGVELVIQRADEGTLPKLPTWPAEG